MKKRFRKTTLTLLLSAMLALQPFTACTPASQKDQSQTTAAQTQDINEDFEQNQQTAKPSNKIMVEQISSLEEVKPNFRPYQKNIQLDEKSVLQIIDLAMRDAQKFYTDMGAPNMQYNNNLQTQAGFDKFYTEWMNKYYFMARGMSESSLRVDVVTDLPNNPPEDDPSGMMQICETSIKGTLEEYYRNIFGVTVDLSDLNIIPSEEDIENIYISKEAQMNVLEAVYNNIYLSICFDIYNAKCLNPINHTDYYQNYGGFNEDIRRLATIGLYGTRRTTVISGLKEGKLEERLRAIKDMNTYLNNMQKYESEFSNKYDLQNQKEEVQPQR